MFSYMIFDWY